ncbi:lysylphosphatidylglycerol synthase domain-containing protein [Streptomyces sp. NPDC002779]|uniref:lysylphosphatidylglycerol synthase domain-containing protein n=1 Tax=Streptomyces sp. NPDC002779 TaxID=3364664 RepID=UPI00368BDE3A
MTPEPLPAVPTRRRAAYGHTALSLTVLVVAIWLARRHWPVLETGAVRLAVADQGWLLVAGTAAIGTWLCAALAQQGAVPERLPPGRLVAAQFAASAANHVLPAGLGAGAVNLRFLMRCGLVAARAATGVAVKGAAGVIVRAVLIASLAVACPGVLRAPEVSPAVLAAATGALGVVALLAGPLRRRRRRLLGPALADIRAVHARPQRAAALWGGSLAFAVLHCVVLISVTQAIDLDQPPLRVALLYLAASSAAALLPTPGGLGSLDAALALALTAAGAPAAGAASAVLGYRLLTMWLPLLPGLLVLGVLIRRKAL